MVSVSTATDLIPYTAPLTPMESIKSQVEGGLSNESRSIEQTSHRPTRFYEGRTPEINTHITQVFQEISNKHSSGWGLFNGDKTYGIGNIKEFELLLELILSALSERKEFYVLDIGAGNFQWGRSLAKYLNAQKGIPEDVKIHIIGVRGENNLDKEVTKLGKCKLYEFGQFQVETLMHEFQRKGLELANKVDLIISRWCLPHLVDPLGTFWQVYEELLRPGTGYFLFDGFFFLHEDDPVNDSYFNFNVRMIQLCLETGAPFLTRECDIGGSLNHFIMRKPADRSCHLNKEYLGTEYHNDPRRGMGTQTLTRFKELKENNAEPAPLQEGEYRGAKELFEKLRKEGALYSPSAVWGPLQDKDINKKTPPLHIAIAEGDEEAIAKCLMEGCDINESDHTGATPVHLAIKHNNYELFLTLLEKRALTNLCVGGLTPLHFAVQYDFDGRFVKDLIKAGVNVNETSYGYGNDTPLRLAIEHENVKAIELLLEAEAFIKYKNHKSLEGNPIFSSIQGFLPKKFSELEGFDRIIDHIQKGNIVTLTYPGESSGYNATKRTPLNEDSKLVRVIVNPDSGLLDHEYYKEFMDLLIDCKVYDDFEGYPTEKPDLELQFGY